ncbi:hypothetical protein QJS04_geneDACA023981 [Acorus gramineus]|uniref:Leucine-rich repeat-containing N-terminal plant-type domain-containing protein n=1 Tax=Acorus gramineus TaxID=55184 RepID=A0AAV9ALZ9_ACOGR|nr:hypothetical protein QJS04_geneDACA023981 [Acorus gramineus]
MSSGGSLVWLIWFILCVGTVNLSLCSPGSNNTSCLEVERQALLKFKEGLYDPRHRLSSWHGEDCCRWEGIGCDNQTAHVVKLDLNSWHTDFYLGGTVGSSLLDLKHLYYLNLSRNNFEGPIPPFIGSLSELRHLDLSWNSFGGPIPPFIGSLSELRHLDLSMNSFSGAIPQQLGNLSCLQYFSIWENQVNAKSLKWLSGLSTLQHLDLRDVNLSESSDWFQMISTLPTTLSTLWLVNCQLDNQIRGMLPLSFTSSIFGVVDLSSNQFEGPLPPIPTNVYILYLQGNLFSGPIIFDNHESQTIELLDLSNNSINGIISPNICKSHNLGVLDLSDNHLSGELPHCLENLTGFLVVKLANNNLHGKLPSMMLHTELRALQLKNNNFSGEFPSSLKHCKKLAMIDFSQNNFHGNIPSRIYNMDLSNNSLDGEIPESIVNLVELQSLNLSANHLTGKIPAKIGDMNSMLSLDLSRNNLTGPIPSSLSELNFLGDLNLSFNNLSGRIPTGSQLQTFNDTSYEGNYDLCGPPTSKDCLGHGMPRSPASINQDNTADEEMLWLFLGVMLGFILGCWMVWGILLFKKDWRILYFLFLDELGDKVYVAYVLSMRRLKVMKRN